MQIREIAEELLAAQLAAKQIELLTTRYQGLDTQPAYAIAEALRDLRVTRGDRVVGRKIGFTNASLWPIYGVDAPIWGYMYGTTVRSAQVSHVLNLSTFADAKIEPEIVFCLRDVPDVGAHESEILKCVEWVAHGFEIVHSLYPNWKFTAIDAIAAGSLHGALLLGEPVAVDALGSDPVEALANSSVSIFANDQLREVGRGSNVLRNPLTALKHLVDGLHSLPGSTSLKVGDIVTTGTLTAAFSVQPGETWRTEISGVALPGLEVSFR